MNDLANTYQLVDKLDELQDTITHAANAQMRQSDGHTRKVEITNHQEFPDSISTPDVGEVVNAIDNLSQKTDFESINQSLAQVISAINQVADDIELPEPLEQVTVTNLNDLVPHLVAIQQTIAGFTKLPAPQVTVDAPVINIDAPDLSPLESALEDIRAAVDNIRIPQVPDTDNTEIILAISSLEAAVSKPRLTGASTLGSSATNPVTTLESSGLMPKVYDYISIPTYDVNNNPLSVVYKTGGSGGTTVSTLTLTYSGLNIASVTRT